MSCKLDFYTNNIPISTITHYMTNFNYFHEHLGKVKPYHLANWQFLLESSVRDTGGRGRLPLSSLSGYVTMLCNTQPAIRGITALNMQTCMHTHNDTAQDNKNCLHVIELWNAIPMVYCTWLSDFRLFVSQKCNNKINLVKINIQNVRFYVNKIVDLIKELNFYIYDTKHWHFSQ